jgi:hypothetical protein
MRFKYIKIAIMINLLFIVASCKKDVLDTKPLNDFTEQDVWTDYNLGIAYINEIYANLPGDIVNRNLDGATEIEDPNNLAQRTYNVGEVTTVNSPFSDAWDEDYAQIARINLFLANFNPQNGDPDQAKTLRGEALFLRAFFYRELNDLFGGVPIIDKAQSLNDNLLVSRNTYDECVAFILKDLDEASSVLPMPSDAQVGRANKGAALALKSRVLLYAASPLHNPTNDMGKWQSASEAALAVIQGGFGYSLYPDYNQLFLVDNNQEVIFDIQYQYPYRSTQNDYVLNPSGLNGAFGRARPTENFVERYEMTNGKSITDPASGYDAQNPYVNRDKRFYSTVLYNGVQWRGVTVETFNDGAFGPGVNDIYKSGDHMTGYYTKKFLSQKNPIIFQDYRADENWILIRYGEILLNYAEAQLALGNDDVARQYINLVRERAGQPDLSGSLSGSTLLDKYMNERTIELAFEEQHYFDVRRWKTAPQLVGTVRKMVIQKVSGSFQFSVAPMEARVWRDALYYLPIPKAETDKNPNLKQNTGY